MSRRTCDTCGKDKPLEGGKTCTKGHFPGAKSKLINSRRKEHSDYQALGVYRQF